MRVYDCDFCKESGAIEERGCFLRDPEMNVRVLGFRESKGGWIPDRDDSAWRICQPEGMLEVLSEVQEKYPGRPLGDIWLTYYEKLCPASFVDPWFNYWIEIEGACSEYGVLPYPGGLLDQPSIVIDILNSIRIAKNQYYLWKEMERRKKD